MFRDFFGHSFDKDPQQVIGKIRILPIPYDLTTSSLSGTRLGPAKILLNSREFEFYNDEIDWDLTRHVDFHVEDELEQHVVSPQEMLAKVHLTSQSLLKHGDFLLSLGGEHSLTSALVKAHREIYPNLQVIQIDAHADLRNEYQGSLFSHACVMRRVFEMGVPITQIGIRSYSEEESLFLKEHPELAKKMWKAVNLQSSEGFQKLLTNLKQLPPQPIYLTIDVDGLDPSVISTTGTPEPGGLGWYQMLDILQTICFHQQVIGTDVMEFSPVPEVHAANVTVAKLCYKLLSYIFYAKYRHKLN